jgi:hypothetical protein
MGADIHGIIIAYEGKVDFLVLTGVLTRVEKPKAASQRKLTPELFKAMFE